MCVGGGEGGAGLCVWRCVRVCVSGKEREKEERGRNKGEEGGTQY